MSGPEILQRLERLEDHCKIEATKVARLWRMHQGVMNLQSPHVVPSSPATRPGEAGCVRSEAEPWKTYNPLPASLDAKALEESLQSVRERAITYAKAIDAMTIERESLRARVAELEAALESVACRAATAETALESAPAASGAAGTEPVAWAFVTTDGAIVHVSTFEPVPGTATVVPLYAAPQGWLTEEERRLIEGMMESASAFPPTMHWHSGCTVRDTLRILRDLLARSSPPEVVRPKPQVCGIFSNEVRDAEWIAALAAAGVTWKEVRS